MKYTSGQFQQGAIGIYVGDTGMKPVFYDALSEVLAQDFEALEVLWKSDS